MSTIAFDFARVGASLPTFGAIDASREHTGVALISTKADADNPQVQVYGVLDPRLNRYENGGTWTYRTAVSEPASRPASAFRSRALWLVEASMAASGGPVTILRWIDTVGTPTSDAARDARLRQLNDALAQGGAPATPAPAAAPAAPAEAAPDESSWVTTKAVIYTWYGELRAQLLYVLNASGTSYQDTRSWIARPIAVDAPPPFEWRGRALLHVEIKAPPTAFLSPAVFHRFRITRWLDDRATVASDQARDAMLQTLNAPLHEEALEREREQQREAERRRKEREAREAEYRARIETERQQKREEERRKQEEERRAREEAQRRAAAEAERARQERAAKEAEERRRNKGRQAVFRAIDGASAAVVYVRSGNSWSPGGGVAAPAEPATLVPNAVYRGVFTDEGGRAVYMECIGEAGADPFIAVAEFMVAAFESTRGKSVFVERLKKVCIEMAKEGKTMTIEDVREMLRQRIHQDRVARSADAQKNREVITFLAQQAGVTRLDVPLHLRSRYTNETKGQDVSVFHFPGILGCPPLMLVIVDLCSTLQRVRRERGAQPDADDDDDDIVLKGRKMWALTPPTNAYTRLHAERAAIVYSAPLAFNRVFAYEDDDEDDAQPAAGAQPEDGGNVKRPTIQQLIAESDDPDALGLFFNTFFPGGNFDAPLGDAIGFFDHKSIRKDFNAYKTVNAWRGQNADERRKILPDRAVKRLKAMKAKTKKSLREKEEEEAQRRAGARDGPARSP